MARLPVIFISHGSPMLALEGGAWGEALRAWAKGIRPRAILALSAHWETRGLAVTSAARPGVLHDFGGFPAELYRLDYPAPGDPALAARVQGMLGAKVDLDERRPLDHGVWAPLRSLYPDADIPVVQLSLPLERDPEGLLDLGKRLSSLRDEDVLVLASGGLVHNLGLLDWHGNPGPSAWAGDFEEWMAARVKTGDLEVLQAARCQAPNFPMAVPTSEHFDPLYFALGAAEGDPVHTVFEGWQLGSLSLRCWAWA